MNQPVLDLSPKVSDEIRKTTCYMCACRCGIDVHMVKGKVAYIEGNRDHPVNRGVLCAKGAAGIMQHNAPSRLKAPMKRTGPRGSGQFETIGWDEAYAIAEGWLRPIRETAPEKLAFFTGRDQSQSFTSLWAQAFGTPNYAAHGGFCSVNMAAGGIYTMGGAFWEFGQPDWERTKLFLLFGVAEDHDSNPIKIGLGKLKKRGAKVVGINPVRSGYNAVADDWFGVTPGTDGLLILSLVHCLLKAGRIDLEYLRDFTDAPVLIDADPTSPTNGLALLDDDGRKLVWDRTAKCPRPYDAPDVNPDLAGVWEVDGIRHRTVFQHLAEKYLDRRIRPRSRRRPRRHPRPPHPRARRRDRPRGLRRSHRARPRMDGLPRPAPQDDEGPPRLDARHARHLRPCQRVPDLPRAPHAPDPDRQRRDARRLPLQAALSQARHRASEAPLQGHPRRPARRPAPGLPAGPRRPRAAPRRLPRAHRQGLHLGEPDVGPRHDAHGHLQRPCGRPVPHRHAVPLHGEHGLELLDEHVGHDEDALGHERRTAPTSSRTSSTRTPTSSEMVAYADLILPDTTYLERHDCISLLDRPICEAEAAADAIRWPVVEPDRDVKGFQSALVDLGARLGLPGFVNEDGSQKFADYADYIVSHERRPGIGPLMGFRGNGEDTGRGAPNPAQIDRYIENGGFCVSHIPEEAQFYKPWNTAYQDWAVEIGLFDKPAPYLFTLWCEPLRRFQLAAEGHGDRQPPDHLRARIRATMDPLPIWWDASSEQDGDGEFTVNALTQRPMAMYHSWGSQNAWLRQIHGRNPMYVPTELWERHEFDEDSWARITSPHGAITVPVAHMPALNRNTIWTWNAIGKRRGAWALHDDAPEAKEGFLLNHLIHELMPPRKDGMRWSNSDPDHRTGRLVRPQGQDREGPRTRRPQVETRHRTTGEPRRHRPGRAALDGRMSAPSRPRAGPPMRRSRSYACHTGCSTPRGTSIRTPFPAAATGPRPQEAPPT